MDEEDDMSSYKFVFAKLKRNPVMDMKLFLEYLYKRLSPLITDVSSHIRTVPQDEIKDFERIKDEFSLTISQIKKCILNVLLIHKRERIENLCVKESRQYAYDCFGKNIQKLIKIKKFLDYNVDGYLDHEIPTTLYFVHWIDCLFENLSSLAQAIYNTDYKKNEKLLNQWKTEIEELVAAIHISLNELLLSALTLGKYCLNEDQLILKARCLVVLRESKMLFKELLGNISDTGNINPKDLKLPIFPTNVNMMIDVLRDSMYLLETSTNTALMNLLLHCLVYSDSPVDILRSHFSQSENQSCACGADSSNSDRVSGEEEGVCNVVNDYDLYNERLMQIGYFAISCSSDKSRILALESCLLHLTSLEPNLLPAIKMSPLSHHAKILSSIWKREIRSLKTIIFLIIDPAVFIERCQQYMRKLYVEKQMQESDINDNLWDVLINIGTLVYEFFDIYAEHEPDVIQNSNELISLLAYIQIVIKECRCVSLLMKDGKYALSDTASSNPPVPNVKNFSKRIRLMYSLVKKIKLLLQPKDELDLFQYELDEENTAKKFLTQIVYKQEQSYRNAGADLSRSVFVRNIELQKPFKSSFLSHKSKINEYSRNQNHLKFSSNVSALFQLDESVLDRIKTTTAEEQSCKEPFEFQVHSFPFFKKPNETYDVENDEQTEALDENSLQISDILTHIDNISQIDVKMQEAPTLGSEISFTDDCPPTIFQCDPASPLKIMFSDISPPKPSTSKTFPSEMIPSKLLSSETTASGLSSPGPSSTEISSQKVSTIETLSQAVLTLEKLSQRVSTKKKLPQAVLTPETLCQKVSTPETSSQEVLTPKTSSQKVSAPSSQEISTPETLLQEVSTPETSFHEVSTSETLFQDVSTPETPCTVILSPCTSGILSSEPSTPGKLSPGTSNSKTPKRLLTETAIALGSRKSFTERWFINSMTLKQTLSDASTSMEMPSKCHSEVTSTQKSPSKAKRSKTITSRPETLISKTSPIKPLPISDREKASNFEEIDKKLDELRMMK